MSELDNRKTGTSDTHETIGRLPAPFSPEMKAEMDRLLTLELNQIDFTSPPDDETRRKDALNNAVWNVAMPAVASVRRLVIEPDASLDAAACEAVVYEPHDADDGLIFFIHGGGWAFMNLDTHERFMRVLCNEAKRTVVGVHYRLAPENPYPAALNDVVSSFRAVMSSRRALGLPDGSVVIAGDSAGGNLAMATMLHESGAGRALPAGGLLFYGVLGADFATPSYRTYAEGYLLTEAVMRQLWDWYAPDEATRLDPCANPAMASDDALRSLPPLFLVVAELDPLASDTLMLKERLDRLGRDDGLWLEPGVTHGYLQMTAFLEAARRTTREAAAAADRFILAASRS